MWDLHEEGYHMRIMKQEEEPHQLTRMFGRYGKMRTAALSEIREMRDTEKQPDVYRLGGSE